LAAALITEFKEVVVFFREAFLLEDFLETFFLEDFLEAFF